MRLLAIIIPVVLILAIFVYMTTSVDSGVYENDHAFAAVQIGDPIEMLDPLFNGAKAERRGGMETAEWIDDFPFLKDDDDSIGDVAFRLKGLPENHVWRFNYDDDKRITEKFRLQN